MLLLELSFNATHEAVDWVCTLLAATDYTGLVHVTPYTEPALNYLVASEQAGVQRSWAFTIYLYLPNDPHLNKLVEKIVNQFEPLQRVGLITAPRTAMVDQKLADTLEESPLVHRIGQRFVVLTPDAPY